MRDGIAIVHMAICLKVSSVGDNTGDGDQATDWRYIVGTELTRL